MTPRVKICGITTPEAVEAAKEADYLGFIFFPASPRNLTPAKAATLAAKSKLPSVAVTVNPDDDFLRALLADFKPGYLQLHGSETPERVRAIKETFKIPVIKAVSVHTGDDITKAKAYEDAADMLMFDAKTSGALPGGMGISFDWRLLARRSFAKPWFLSGGLSAGNVEEAVRISGAQAVDVSSGVESSPGVKAPALVREFIRKVKGIE